MDISRNNIVLPLRQNTTQNTPQPRSYDNGKLSMSFSRYRSVSSPVSCFIDLINSTISAFCKCINLCVEARQVSNSIQYLFPGSVVKLSIVRYSESCIPISMNSIALPGVMRSNTCGVFPVTRGICWFQGNGQVT